MSHAALSVLSAATPFSARIRDATGGRLVAAAVETVQVNVGRVCNQACHHCHVEAGPTRTESMDRRTVDRLLWLLERSPGVQLVDITGGAPELNPNFRYLVKACRKLGRRVMDRCNLTVLSEPGMEDLAAFLAEEEVEVTASLPCYTEGNVDAQRGRGVFERSIEGLQKLNALGYGQPESSLRLDLVYNPGGAFLPGPQAALEADYKARLWASHRIQFHRLLTLANMPIRRFRDDLERKGELGAYQMLLEDAFNPETVDGLMCRRLVSVGYDGRLFDCDFNQMLEMPVAGQADIFGIDAFVALAERPIAVAGHCFGCTAGAGSSCGGALAEP